MAIRTGSIARVLQLTRVTLRTITAAEEESWDRLMAQTHPLGNAHFPGHQLKYVAEYGERAVALACFSGSAYHLADRDRWIGWSTEQAQQRRHFVVQNSRFLLLPKAPRPNLASRVLALCARQVPEDWHRHFGFRPLLLETFVDPTRFRGTCYRAAGWTLVGRTRGFRRDGQEFYTPDSHPKDIWLKALAPQMPAVLRAAKLPPEWQPYEKALPPEQVAKRLGVSGLRSLFEVLRQLKDTRDRHGLRYRLATCLALVVCAWLAGSKGVRAAAEFAANLTQAQLRALRSWRHPRTGRYHAPKFTTFWRVAQGLDGEQFERLVMSWFRDEGLDPEALALDGKSLRATLANADGGTFVVSVLSHLGTPLFSIKN
jgi:hypothetical protein